MLFATFFIVSCDSPFDFLCYIGQKDVDAFPISCAWIYVKIINQKYDHLKTPKFM